MGSSKANQSPAMMGGFRAVFGCTEESLALYRIALGFFLVYELVTRFQYLHPFYSDEGTLPLRLLLPDLDWLYKAVSIHVHMHNLWEIQLVLAIQVLAAVSFTVGYKTRIMAVLSWYLYLSLTLRNTWLNFILDRYFHFLLFYAMFLPCGECWSLDATLRKDDGKKPKRKELVVSPGTIGLKCLVFWLYLDAGGGKYMDPLGGWTYSAKPLPALDTYTRHTTFARYMYAALGPAGLRAMTPTVVYVELLAVPVALIGSYLGMPGLVNIAAGTICQLHVGIALCMNNAALLSFVACSVWCVFLPVGWDKITVPNISNGSTSKSSGVSFGSIFSAVVIGSMIAGNFWFATIESCDQMIFYSTILHCRWNVFVGAEEYVTWEIAPGLLVDGSIVDVWGRKNSVDWNLPGSGAPCTSTARPGRWRSFPYLAELEGEDAEALWSYLCRQWDDENEVDKFPDRQLMKFNFFMLQSDVLPNMGFSATRKRLIQSYECVKSSDLPLESLPQSEIEDSPDDQTIENEQETTSDQFTSGIGGDPAPESTSGEEEDEGGNEEHETSTSNSVESDSEADDTAGVGAETKDEL